MRVTFATSMSPMSAVHEDVHEWASQQQQEWQRAEKVGAVFGEQEIQRNAGQDDQTDGSA